ncbi:MAG: cyclase family protein [Bacteroidetes bacterium]|nr:cyclase family protein [Bacteroidota bacterium]
MEISFTINGRTWKCNSNEWFDLSFPLRNGEHNPNAYYIGPPKFEPFCSGGFVGSVAQGGACNCEDIHFNAHGNGTHTECVGHITPERYPIRLALKDVWIPARVISVIPEPANGDQIIKEDVLENVDLNNIKAVIIRTLPNSTEKSEHQYSGSNPTYLSPALTKKLADNGIDHLLLDLPSVDREEDGGALLAHHAFWNYPENPRMHATITELIFVPDAVSDGTYMLNIQIASFDSDASPSRPLLFPVQVL